MTSQLGFFENLDYSRKLYFYYLSDRKGVDVKRSSRLAARNQVDRDYQKTFTKKRKASK
jgi:hypothetical protein